MKHKLYNRLLSLALAVGLVIGMLPSAAAVDTVGGSAGQAALNVSADNGLKLLWKHGQPARLPKDSQLPVILCWWWICLPV